MFFVVIFDALLLFFFNVAVSVFFNVSYVAVFVFFKVILFDELLLYMCLSIFNVGF